VHSAPVIRCTTDGQLGRAEGTATTTTDPPARASGASPDDKALVLRAQGGDRGAFADLYRSHAPAVARLARSRLSPAAAEDATAESFARAWASLGRYRDTGRPFVAWLYGIARHVITDAHRADARVRPTDDLDDLDDPAVDGHSDRRAGQLDLYAAIGRLKGKQRQVVELKYLAGLNNDEVAAALGTTPGAVNTMQWRALRNLERSLEQS